MTADPRADPTDPAHLGMLPGVAHAGIQSAAQVGRVSAVAAEGQRDLRRWAAQAPDIFPSQPFDATLFGTVCLANAFSAPALDAADLVVVNRASLWGFAVDWQIDYLATGRDEAELVVRRCLAVADGDAPEPNDQLTAFLTGIQGLMASRMDDTSLQAVWHEELRRMLAGMAREWDWRDTGRLPGLDEYLDNADNLGSSFVNLSHWIYTRTDAHIPDVDLVLTATREQQRVIRLLNDLGTYRRDVDWGDVNALMLGVGVAEVVDRVGTLVERCHEAFEPLRPSEPELVEFLERQIGFCMGFYRVTDYWGEL